MASLAIIPAGTVVTTEKVVTFPTPSEMTAVQVGINVTAASGTSPTLTPFLEVLGGDGVWYPVWTHAALTAAGQVVAAVGPMASSNPAVFTGQARLRLETGGTTPSFTLSASVNGQALTS